MKSKKNSNGLYSLADVQKRKHEIKKELKNCEANIQESYYNFTHPISFVSKFLGCDCTANNEDASPIEALGDVAFKVKRIIGVVGTAISVYDLIQSFRKRRT